MKRGQPYIETIPKRGYRFIGDIKEVSNYRVTYEEGTREQITIEDIDSDTRSFSYWWVAAAAVVVSIAAFVWQRGVLAARQPRSILVLPFASAGDADELLRFGFTQDLAARLRTVRGVRVITPVTDAGANDLTNKTAVDTILTGRLTGAGSQIRVAAYSGALKMVPSYGRRRPRMLPAMISRAHSACLPPSGLSVARPVDSGSEDST